jgi:methionyl-tRNA formyltransferase
MHEQLRIVFMGTPEFAVHSLIALLEEGHHIVAVVTAPDKPAGRGRNLHQSPVKEAALQHSIPILQPVSLKDPLFLDELRSYNANLQVVVAFRMLPEIVWNMPLLGTFNLHASLLPQYRGAAPINHAIINGETETGITTFFLSHEIDTGKVIFREKHPILPEDDAGTLHDRLAVAGASLVCRTVEAIRQGKVDTIDQSNLFQDSIILKGAPKIFKENCLIRWDQPASRIYNLIRGLSPYPTAFTRLKDPLGHCQVVKIYKTHLSASSHELEPGDVLTDGISFISVQTQDGGIYLDEVQLEGKKRMTTEEFLRGFRYSGNLKFE